jgi:hypothetical protein
LRFYFWSDFPHLFKSNCVLTALAREFHKYLSVSDKETYPY